MKVVDIRRDGSSLRITCCGVYGIGSEGNPSGSVLQSALEAALSDAGAVSEVIVDYSAVEYEWGDGPLWSAFPALRRGLPVVLVTNKDNRKPLEELVRQSGNSDWIRLA